MNVVYKLARLAILARFMLVAQIVLLLVACGNKGDLYLEQTQLTEEQKELLDGLDKGGLDTSELDKQQKLNELDESESLEEDDDEDDKKKTTNPETTE